MDTVTHNTTLIFIFAAIIGLIVGSFLNMLIYRLPIMILSAESPTHKLNLATPASFCPHCKHPLKWHDNIPLIGFLLQRGHCRHCHNTISPRYLCVEIIAMLIPLCTWPLYHLSYQWLFACLFCWITLSLIIIDFKHQLLPDLLNYVLLWLGLLASTQHVFISPNQAIYGAIIGYLSLFLVAKGFYLLRRKQGLGHGDMKLLAAIGAFVGPAMLLPVILISSISALIMTIFMLSIKKWRSNQPIAFGPYLALGGAICLIAQNSISQLLYS